MQRATITTAKDGPSEFLDRVEAGETILIGHRGVPVARRGVPVAGLEPATMFRLEPATTFRLDRRAG